MKKIHLILILILVLSLMSCSPKFILLNNGLPAPEHTETGYTSNGLKITAHFMRVYMRDIDKTEIEEWIAYYPFGKEIQISPQKTKGIILALAIWNPNNVQYSVEQKIITEFNGSGDTLLQQRTIYSGRKTATTHIIYGAKCYHCRCKLKAVVYDASGMPLFTTPEAIYKIF